VLLRRHPPHHCCTRGDSWSAGLGECSRLLQEFEGGQGLQSFLGAEYLQQGHGGGNSDGSLAQRVAVFFGASAVVTTEELSVKM
jgi:hypothetical protein